MHLSLSVGCILSCRRHQRQRSNKIGQKMVRTPSFSLFFSITYRMFETNACANENRRRRASGGGGMSVRRRNNATAIWKSLGKAIIKVILWNMMKSSLNMIFLSPFLLRRRMLVNFFFRSIFIYTEL